MARPKLDATREEVLKINTENFENGINEFFEAPLDKETQEDFSLFDKPEVVVEVKNNLSLPSEVSNKAVKPIRHIFQIKELPSENATYNGALLPGKKIIDDKFCFTYIVTDLNDDVKNKEAFNAFTGLEEDHLDMNDGLSEDEKIRLAKEGRIAKAYIEKRTNQSAEPTNISFWGSKTLIIKDLGLVYDTAESLDALMWYHIIQAGGVKDIARNYEDAVVNEKRLYLSVANESVERDFEDKKYKLESFAILDDIYKRWSMEDTLFLTYIVSKRQHGFTKNTSRELIINELEEFVEGVGIKTDKKKRPAEFIKIVNFFKDSKDKAKCKGLFNAAVYYGFIGLNQKGEYYNKETGFSYGNVEQLAS
jgi:hypothetical protein